MIFFFTVVGKTEAAVTGGRVLVLSTMGEPYPYYFNEYDGATYALIQQMNF